MQHEALILSLYRIGAIQFGEFTLKSGQTSRLYLNLRKIISYPVLLKQIADALVESCASVTPDFICGVPYTALPIATCISLTHQRPMVMRRKEIKNYGTKQRIEGDFTPGQTCLVIEDVITSGASLAETTLDLEAAGLVVTDVAALIDREQGGKETLAKKVRVHTVLTLTDIANTLLNSADVTPHDKYEIQHFMAERASTCS